MELTPSRRKKPVTDPRGVVFDTFADAIEATNEEYPCVVKREDEKFVLTTRKEALKLNVVAVFGHFGEREWMSVVDFADEVGLTPTRVSFLLRKRWREFGCIRVSGRVVAIPRSALRVFMAERSEKEAKES